MPPQKSPPRPNDRLLLQQIITGMNEGVILVEQDRSIVWANQAALAMHKGKRVADLGADVDGYFQRFELRSHERRRKLGKTAYPLYRAVRGERLEDEVVAVVPRGQSTAPTILQMHSLPVTGESGEPDCYALVLRDVTEQCEAEERFERTFATNPAPAFIARLSDLRIVKVNKGFLEMAGYAATEAHGRSMAELGLLPEGETGRLIGRHLRDGTTIPQTETPLCVAGGGTKLVIVAGQPLEMGEDRCMLFTFMDLEPRRVAEVALRQSEERFAKVFRLAPVPMLVAGRQDGRILDANEAFEQTLGYPLAETVGQTLQGLHLWRDPGELRTFERTLQASGSLRNQETTVLSHARDALQCLVSAERLDINGQDCILTVLQDISDRKRNEVELIAAIEAVMQDTSWFSRGVIEKLAHIRQPGGPRPGGEPAIDDLTDREQQVLGALCMGLTDAEIGERLGISRNTVRNHLATVYEKIGVNRRAAAVVWARERGFTGATKARRRGR